MGRRAGGTHYAVEVEATESTLAVRFDREQLTFLQLGALDWLRTDPLLEADTSKPGVIRFGLEWWHAAGELPRASDEEAKDLWTHRHEAIAALLGLAEQAVEVNVTGFLGGRDFAFLLVVGGIALDPRSEAPIAGGTGLLPGVYRAQRILSQVRTPWPRSKQVETLAHLRDQLNGTAALLAASSVRVPIEFAEHVRDVKIRHVTRGHLAWAPAGIAEGLFSLELTAADADGQRTSLDVGGLDPDAPLISTSAKDHVLLSEDLAAAARAVKEHRNVPASRIAASPLDALPVGRTYEDLDLSDYSVRVAGFGPIPKATSEGRAGSGVEWYRRDDEAVGGDRSVVVSLSTPSGERLELTVDGDGLPALLQQARNAVDGGTTIEIGGHAIRATPAVVAELERATIDHLQPSPRRPTSNAGEQERPTKTRDAALIDEDAALDRRSVAFDTSEVPWASLEQILAPGLRLQEHQREGIAWLWRHHCAGSQGVMLADEMGLGKTLQIACFLALKALSHEAGAASRSSLIVGPLILLDNWERELDRYFKPNAVPRRQVVRSGLLRAGGLDLLADGRRWVIMAYDTLARHQKGLLRIDWDTVVLDESQNVKNPGTYRTAAARGLKRSFGICSTGTPIENRLRDLWTQFDFLSPGRPFSTKAKPFCEEFEDSEIGTERLRGALTFPSPVSPVLHREKRGVLSGLPACHVYRHDLPMTAAQVEQERAIVSRGRHGLEILGDLQKLYQHPALLQPGEPDEALTLEQSAKFTKCMALLDEIQGKAEKAIIFALFTRMQELLRRAMLQRFGLLRVDVVNGASNQKKMSQGLIDRFSQRPGFNVLVLSPLVAGAGLNITAANHVIHYGRWWNPAREDQATARAHRIGQTRDVHVHHLVLHHPGNPHEGFDVKLHEHVEGKRGLAMDFLSPTEDPSLMNVLEAP